MKSQQLFILYLIHLCTCTGCVPEGKEVGAILSRHFVQGYIMPESLSISPVLEEYKVYIYCSGEIIYPPEPLFNTLSLHYGDVSYNKRIVPGALRCVADTLLYINVVSNTDYDAVHTAGTSLNDIIEVEFSSPLKYIQSQYEDMPQSEMRGTFRPRDEFSPFRIGLDEIMKEDLILTYYIMCLNFISFPSNPNQIITVETATGSGKQFSRTRELEFN
jgi:hypothetical protein